MRRDAGRDCDECALHQNGAHEAGNDGQYWCRARARAIHPYHTQSDGNQMLAVSTGLRPGNASLTAFGAITAEVVADAMVRAVMTAPSVTGWTARPRFVNLRIA
jgi:hypothetical protein